MKRALLVASSLLSSASAAAQTYTAREVAGWTVASADTDLCAMSIEYEGEGSTKVTLALGINGENHLMVGYYNWSIKKGVEVKLDYEISRGVYEDHFSLGTERDLGGGFITTVEAAFPEYFAESTFLAIRRDGKLVDKLDLKGSGAAVIELRRCVSILKARADAEAREKARWSHIPKDPFAEEGK